MTLACWKPASSARRRIYSAPSLWLRFMLAMVGRAIQSCSRLTEAAWPALTAVVRADRSLGVGAAQTGAERIVAEAARSRQDLRIKGPHRLCWLQPETG